MLPPIEFCSAILVHLSELLKRRGTKSADIRISSGSFGGDRSHLGVLTEALPRPTGLT
ncbi:MAG: hypothetical protein F6K28_51115 [Microcoleus sp. SIO2G3]|nr:hypothetical protein [Microcoleus sp. SIO2G3]